MHWPTTATCECAAPYGGFSRLLTNIRSRSRTGTNLSFLQVIAAVHLVYNISYPLAIFLTSVGFLTCGKFSWPRPPRSSHPHTLFNGLTLFLMSFFIPSWTLDLAALSARGAHKITHNASFVHPDNVSSTAPDPQMVERLIDYASRIKEIDDRRLSGLSLFDFAHYHARRETTTPMKHYNIHEQVALGEGALTWLVLHRSSETPVKRGPYSGIVPTERVRQWLGEERLPDGWWDYHGVRPSATIGLWRARRVADLIKILMEIGI